MLPKIIDMYHTGVQKLNASSFSEQCAICLQFCKKGYLEFSKQLLRDKCFLIWQTTHVHGVWHVCTKTMTFWRVLISRHEKSFITYFGYNIFLYLICHWGIHDNPTKWKADIKEAKEWNSFHLSGKELDYFHLKDFLKYKCELHLKQPLTPPPCNIIVAYNTSNHRLGIETTQWSTILNNTRLCHFCFYSNVVEKWGTLCVGMSHVEPH